MKNIDEKFELSNTNIDKISKLTEDFLINSKIEKKHIISVKLSLEEVLNNFMKSGAKNCNLEIKNFFGKCKISVSSQGEEFNPFVDYEDDSGYAERLSSILNKYKAKTEYTRRKNLNIASWYLPRKKLNSIAVNSLTILFSILFGLALSTLPETTRQFISTRFFEPSFSCFLSLISTVASFMIFLSIILGITGMRDVSSFGKYGSNTIKTMMKLIVIYSVFYYFADLLIFKRLSFSGSSSSLSAILADFYKTILNIVPSDLISPFITKNMLQISFIAVCLGLLILATGNNAKNVSSVFEELNLIAMKGITVLCNLIPVCIFLSITPLVIKGDFSSIIKTWKYFVVIIVLETIQSIFLYTFYSIKLKIPFIKLVKDNLGTCICGFSTASSFACIGHLKEFVVNKNKGDEKNFNFIFSMIQLFYKPDFLIDFFIIPYFFLHLYGMNISLSLSIVAAFMVILFMMATPAIPGGTIITWGAILTLFGIPSEAMAVIISINVFADMILTGFKMFGMGPVILSIDRKLQEKI